LKIPTTKNQNKTSMAKDMGILLETRKTFSSHSDLYLYVDCNIENGKLKLKRAITDSSLESGHMRRGVQ
jgi:hypothetical protein